MKINISRAKAKRSNLVDVAAAGEDVVITRHGHPVARLMKLEEKPRRQFGWDKSITIADNFDTPLPPDVLAGFEGR